MSLYIGGFYYASLQSFIDANSLDATNKIELANRLLDELCICVDLHENDALYNILRRLIIDIITNHADAKQAIIGRLLNGFKRAVKQEIKADESHQIFKPRTKYEAPTADENGFIIYDKPIFEKCDESMQRYLQLVSLIRHECPQLIDIILRSGAMIYGDVRSFVRTLIHENFAVDHANLSLIPEERMLYTIIINKQIRNFSMQNIVFHNPIFGLLLGQKTNLRDEIMRKLYCENFVFACKK